MRIRNEPPLPSGTQVMATQMASGYEPPSMSLGADALDSAVDLHRRIAAALDLLERINPAGACHCGVHSRAGTHPAGCSAHHAGCLAAHLRTILTGEDT
jgi:hypothetical protein